MGGWYAGNLPGWCKIEILLPFLIRPSQEKTDDDWRFLPLSGVEPPPQASPVIVMENNIQF